MPRLPNLFVEFLKNSAQLYEGSETHEWHIVIAEALSGVQK